MESFFRYISYIDYLENGVRVQTAGFLRWKLQNEKHKIEIQIKDIPKVHGSFPIVDVGTGIILDSIFLDNGIGNYKKSFSGHIKNGKYFIQTSQGELELGILSCFEINLKNSRILKIPIELPIKRDSYAENVEKRQAEKQIDITQKNNIEKDNTEDMPVYKRNNRETVLINENIGEIEAASENVLINGIEEKYEISLKDSKREFGDEDIDMSQEDEGKETCMEPIEIENEDHEAQVLEPVLYENKWQQLCARYPKVRPFKSGRDFLSIKPEDFIILQQGYQRLVHNSFLLHGFYNYQHMILGRLSDAEEAPYYVGVPGVYYDREKQAAQMFGFAGFESTEQPVQNGSYGYYMIEVEI